MTDRPRSTFEQWADAARGRPPVPVEPAATVVLLRDGPAGIETLMLRKNSRLAFGGMWVFPGGRIDPDDHDPDDDPDDPGPAARRAAVREALEEAAVRVDPDELVWFAHWTPPPIAPKRFATWFFAARAGGDRVVIDGGEIHDHAWMTPADALRRRDGLEIELAPPTWVTLHYLAAHDRVADALAAFAARQPRFYETHIGHTDDGPVALWEGDAGYDAWDATVPGSRHRLVMAEQGYRFDDSARPWR